MTHAAQFPVMDIDDVTAVFPVNVSHLMPGYSEIPEEFKRRNGTPWNRLMAEWFYCGLSELNLTPKPGIDQKKALRHIKAVMGSFEPKHEHKEAAIAYLLSQWFEDGATWTVKPRQT